MRLLLSSSGISTVEPYWQRLHQLAGESSKVLFINNAKDDYSPADRKVDVAEKIEGFWLAGFDAVELDLREYFEKPEKLLEVVDTASFIWASGGNEFLLRRAYAYSGFDNLLTEALHTDKLLYGGSSAGMMILTNTLRGCEEWDNANSVPEGYASEIIWDGLGLIDVQLVPHYESDWANAEAQRLIDYYEREGINYITLRDGEAYLIDGEKREILK